MKLRSLADAFLDRYGVKLAVLGAFLIPIKLSLSLIVILTLTLISFFSSDFSKVLGSQTAKNLLLFLAFASIAACFGIRPSESLPEVLGLVFYAAAFVPFYFAGFKDWRNILLAIVCGQAFAGLHSAADSALGWGMPRYFPGRVTESGQLAVVVFGALALLSPEIDQVAKRGLSKIAAGALFLSLIICGFSAKFIPSNFAVLPVGLIAIITVGFVAWILINSKRAEVSRFALIAYAALPIISAALVLNLKRGPWAGVFCGLIVILWRYRRALIIPIFLAGLSVVIGVTPIRDRLLESSENFFDKGGRNTIWQVALDVSFRFPLGVGLGNSRVLREFAPDVPEGLTHFHSNPLNILAETGWVGLFLFFGFVTTLLKSLISRYDGPVPTLIIGALISWQVAGLVEYNIGDTEVLLAVVAVLGVLSSQVQAREPKTRL